jgi:hypothetical protein
MPARQRDHRDPTADKGRLRTELREQRREIQRLRMVELSRRFTPPCSMPPLI